MKYFSQIPVRLFFDIKSDNFCELIFVHFENITTNGSGGAVYFSNQFSCFSCSHCFFVKTSCISGQHEGGGIYLSNSNNTKVKCSSFEHNFAYYTNALFISFRNSNEWHFPAVIDSICEANSQPIEECNNHLDIIAGDPLSFKNSNISNIECQGCGFFVDYCEKGKKGVISYINFADLNIESYYKFDQEILPESPYFDHINMKNISAVEFFRHGCLDKKPFFFECNIISDHEISCNPLANFINRYITTQIKGSNNINETKPLKFLIQILTDTCILNIKSQYQKCFFVIEVKKMSTFFTICSLIF